MMTGGDPLRFQGGRHRRSVLVTGRRIGYGPAQRFHLQLEGSAQP